jgi:hypothetical protein
MIDEDSSSNSSYFSSQNCPEEVASKDKECDDLKNWVKKCRSSVYSFTEVADRIKTAA